MIATAKKNDVLRTLAELLSQNEAQILAANEEDVAAYEGGDESMFDRLIVDSKKVAGMIRAVEEGIALNDPVGRVLYTFQPENGLRIENRLMPFGNILIIYESRPDVTIEAALTAFKAGNKIRLKGGKEARNTNLVLADLWHTALDHSGVSRDYIHYLDLNRQQTQDLIKKNTENIDLIIPRGGEGLINFVRENTDIPIIVSGRGNNFLYIEAESDFEMAVEIILNGKKRISVCNALDKVLIDKHLPDIDQKLNRLIEKLQSQEIRIVGDETFANRYSAVEPADRSALFEEFLAAKIMIIPVGGLYEAVECINTYSGKHSATIITSNPEKAEAFLLGVDCAAVYHNASTRFTDGGQFGFGAEMAISTQKVHFRGPIGIDQLVTNKWFIYGTGQTRP